MVLLVSVLQGLRTESEDIAIHGEDGIQFLSLDSDQFHIMVLQFCKAYEVGRRALSNLLIEFQPLLDTTLSIHLSTGPRETRRHDVNATYVFSELEKRGNALTADRIAILSNCFQCRKRLNTASLARKGYGLSTCILVLCLLNGEIPKFPTVGRHGNVETKHIVPLSGTLGGYLDLSSDQYLPVHSVRYKDWAPGPMNINSSESGFTSNDRFKDRSLRLVNVVLKSAVSLPWGGCGGSSTRSVSPPREASTTRHCTKS